MPLVDFVIIVTVVLTSMVTMGSLGSLVPFLICSMLFIIFPHCRFLERMLDLYSSYGFLAILSKSCLLLLPWYCAIWICLLR